jgi:hypothetical protein
MHISRGEIIAVMEDQQYIQLQQDYLTSKAHFSYLEKEFQRQKELNESKASSDKVFENAQAEYLTQKILIKSLSEKLKLISINPEGIPLLHLDLGFIEGTVADVDDPTAFVSDYTTRYEDIVDTVIFWASHPTIRQIEFRWKLTPYVYDQLKKANPNLDPSRVQF